jgi:hypothetical protein
LPPFGPDDYDEGYIVAVPRYGKVKTLSLHYGEPPTPKVAEQSHGERDGRRRGARGNEQLTGCILRVGVPA